MKNEQILMTRLFLDEPFSDVALYSGKLYVWKNKQTLHLYDWNTWMDHISFGELPIYQNPFPFQKLSFQISDLTPYFKKEILFEKDVEDFFLYNHDLYCLTQEGFFVLTPESTKSTPHLLAKGDFNSLLLSDKNRVALSGKETGVFEYFLSDKLKVDSEQNHFQNPLHKWDQTPTYFTKWDGHDLLQLDENKNAVQLINFHVHKNQISIEDKKKKERLKEQNTYYNESLNLRYQKETDSWNALFQYLQPEETKENHSFDAFQNREIPVAIQPNPFFVPPLLDDKTIYVEENSSGLYLTIQNESYLHIPSSDYIKWASYPKSRNYQNHLHLLSKHGITFFIFHEIE